jgi:zinc protease
MTRHRLTPSRLRAFAGIAAAFAALMLAACQPGDAPAAGEGGLSVPPLAHTFRQLPNGLRVYAMPDQSTANVSVQVWYDVGSKDDPPGRSGFAHLFEHIMFKSTTNMPPEFMDRLTEDAGGFNNASTWNDFTNYYETVPANHLERVLWGEAERMGSLVVDEANFLSERDVVKEEFRQGILAQPYGKLFGLYLNQAAYSVHPYGRPGIGSIEQLDAATIEDVRAFHATYYRPDNAVLVVAGRFEPAEFDAMVDKYFGPIATPARSIPRVTAVEPERSGPKDLTVYEPNVPLPAIAINWPGLDTAHPDLAAWMVADAILSRGQSSRLYQSLVYTQQLAAQAGSQIEINKDPGLASAYVILSEGKSVEDGLASLNAEIARMRDEPVTAAELDEAKNELVTETLGNRETADGRAFELAQAVIMFGDPNASDDLLARLQAVTAEDVQRVSRLVFDPSKAITIRYLPEDIQNGAPEATFADAPTIQATPLTIAAADIPVYTLAPEAERVAPPAAGPAVTVQLPTPAEKTLANGLRVIVAEKPGLPLISASLRIGSGGAADPADKAGLAAMTADLVARGTTTRSASAIASEIESLGAGIGSSAGPDATDVSIGGRADKAEEMFAVMADVVMNPAFAEEELERARQETLDGLLVGLRQPSTVGNIAMTRALYGAGPYGAVASPRSIGAIDQAAIKELHAANWRPDNAVLVIAGDISPENGFALAERTLGAWARPGDPFPIEANAAQGAPEPRLIAIDMPQIGQAAVMMGLRGLARTDADFFPLLVANDVLGGGYSARLNAEIRIKRGLSYGARATLSARQAPGSLVASAQTRNDAVPQVVELMAAELSRLGAEPIPAAELEARKAVLIGGFGRSVETTAGLAGQLSALAQFGLPLEKLSTYAADVAAVTAEAAGSAARKYFSPAMADIVVVGDASVFWRELTAARPGFERINIGELNLDSETLK